MEKDARTAVIVGAGIGGLATAIGLRRAGWRVTVLERARSFAPVGAGLSLMPNAVLAMRALGLGEAVAALPAMHRLGGMYTWRGAPLIIVHRAQLHELLHGAVDPDVIRLDAAVTDIEQDADGVTARLADGSNERGVVLIGADGIHSAVRATIIGDGPPRYAGYAAWRGTVTYDVAGLPIGEFWGPGALFGIVPLPDGQVYWYGTTLTPRGRQDTPAERKTEILTVFADWRPAISQLVAATSAEAILRNDILDRSPRRGWSTGRVTLLGDAAHPMTPSLGQGGCQAIEDAVALADCLSGAMPVPAALAEYERRRYARTAKVVRRSRLNGRLSQLRNPLLCALRNAAIRRTSEQAQLRQLASILRISPS